MISFKNSHFSSLLIINTEVIPPDIKPRVNDVPIIKPIGRATVLLIRKSKLYFFPKFWDPRHRKKINNIAVARFRVKSWRRRFEYKK